MSDALGTLLRTLGPFVVPVALFVIGTVGYVALLALARLGLIATDDEEPASGDGWRRR